MKWMEQHEKIIQTQQCHPREPMDSIACHFVYINLENSIEKIVSNHIDLDSLKTSSSDGKIRISIEHILQLIQTNRISTPTTKYIYQETLLFLVDLDSENLQDFVQSDDLTPISKRFLHVLPLLDDYVIPPSVFVFHHLNCLYFFYKEVINKYSKNPAIKSILKSSHSTRKKYSDSDDLNANLENLVFGIEGGGASVGGDGIDEGSDDVVNSETKVVKSKKKVTMKLLPNVIKPYKYAHRSTRRNLN